MSNGIVNEPSNNSVDETVDRLKAIVQASGAVLFRLVDHSGEVEKVGLEMKPTKLLIYGKPKAGTPLNVASPSLPLKMLVWEDAAKKGGFSTAQNLLKRQWFPEDLLPNISVPRKLASGAAR